MLNFRHWSVLHAGALERVYAGFERVLVRLDPLFRRVGYERLERPVAAVERRIKGLLFGCRMCGQCVLGETGMACPMTCPKQLRNGPCGGVRSDGGCEIVPAMRCVWVEAYAGSLGMREGQAKIGRVQPPVDRRLEGSSAWLRRARLAVAERRP